MLPFGYAARNLFRDPSRMIQTVSGSALVVLLVMAATAVNQGMRSVLSASGSAHNVMLVGAGSEESVLRSEIGERAAAIAESSLTGLAEVAGVRAISPEMHQMMFISDTTDQRSQALVRGVTPRALAAHPEVTLREGRFPEPGEIMVGRLAWKRLGMTPGQLDLGQVLVLEDLPMKIAGRFAAPRTVMESEVWMNVSDLRTISQRENLSCVVLRLDEAEFADVDLFTKQRLDLELSAIRERDYYANLALFYRPLRGMTWITALLMATGALLGGLNTLYAAFSSRIREIGTLEAIGFNRGAILFSLIQESLLTCMTGALAASLVSVWLLDGLTVSFSVGSFVLRVTPWVAAAGLGAGVFLGLVGAIPPACRCLLPPLPQTLRSAG